MQDYLQSFSSLGAVRGLSLQSQHRWPPLALQITTPYTLCSYMVRTYLGAASDGSTEAEERIGRLTGILVSTDDSQMFCRWLMSSPGAHASQQVPECTAGCFSSLKSSTQEPTLMPSTELCPEPVLTST